MDFDEPTTPQQIIEDIITEGEEVIVPLEDEDTSIEAGKVIEPSVNMTLTQEKVDQIEEENCLLRDRGSLT